MRGLLGEMDFMEFARTHFDELFADIGLEVEPAV